MAKKGLPEINVSDGDLVEHAMKLMDARSAKAAAETLEKEQRVLLEGASETIRREKMGKDPKEIVGLIRITNDKLKAPVRIEMKMSDKSALDLDEWDKLKEMFDEITLHAFFQQEKVVTEIQDYEALVADLKAKSIDPNTVLEFKVKKGMDAVLANCKGVGTAEAITPKDEFLANLAEYSHLIKPEAWAYLSEYLAVALKPTVVAGTKGKA